MMTVHKAAIALAVALVSAPAFAEIAPPPAEAARRAVVDVADLDLETPLGMERLNQRINSAVHIVCDSPGNRDLRAASLARSCRRQSLALAMADRDNLLQARTAARTDPARMAALGNKIPVGRR